MKVRTVLVTGAGGQLGRAVDARFAQSDGWSVRARSRSELDITDRDSVLAAVAGADVVLNVAGYTKVDAAEEDPDEAFEVNATGVSYLVEACEEHGAHLCHISTDYVFDGEQDEPYVESDRPNPQSVYGRSKLAGERALRADDLLVRTSWLFGDTGPDMVRTILSLAADPDREMSFVDDQRGCPTFTGDLASTLFDLVDADRAGTFHVTNAGPVTWFDFACEVLDAAGLDPARVTPVTTADLMPARPATRPRNSVLQNRALRLSGLPLLRSHAEVLGPLVQRVINGRAPA